MQRQRAVLWWITAFGHFDDWKSLQAFINMDGKREIWELRLYFPLGFGIILVPNEKAGGMHSFASAPQKMVLCA